MNLKKATGIAATALTLIVFSATGQALAGEKQLLNLDLQRRDPKTGAVITTPMQLDPAKTAIVNVDPWNYHWCITCNQRFGSFMPRMNRALECARRLGIQVLWAPTEAASQYAGTPQRERAAAVPPVAVPHVRDVQLSFTVPVGPCECGPGIACLPDYGLDAINPALVIAEQDLIVSGAEETYAICRRQGITHIIFMGFATNLCLQNRAEGLSSMMAAGLECLVARDLDDAFTRYDPAHGFTPDDGSVQANNDLEKNGVPTIDLVAELKKAGLWQADWIVDPVRLTPWGIEERPYLFEDSVLVTLSLPFVSEARICYTLDGREPTAESTPYEKPIRLTQTTTLRAAAFRAGRLVSLASRGCFVRLPPPPPKPEVYLDELEPVRESYPYWYSSWHPVLNKSFEGEPLMMRGKKYEKGVGMRAPSNLRYLIQPEWGRFVALAGLDGNLLELTSHKYGLLGRSDKDGYGCLLAQQPSAQFRIFIDGTLAAESPKLKMGQAPWRFDVKLPPGARQINLTVTSAEGRRNVLDLADWVNAGFTYAVPWDDPVDADYHHAPAAAYERFRDLKYGIRIAWGPYALQGTEASWPLIDYPLDRQGENHQLYRRFNPTEFNADEWMQLFQRCGLKYFTFTAKHHDGFSMWATQTRVTRRSAFDPAEPSRIEDCDLAYSVAETPFKRDIVRELVEAARRHDIGVNLYFSHWDWYDADFRWSGIGKVPYAPITPESDAGAYGRFLSRYRQQIRELLTNYGRIDGFEFDCEPRATPLPYRARQVHDWIRLWPDIKETVKMARRLQPDVLFRERGIGAYGDFHTPEWQIPSGPHPASESPGVKLWQVIHPAGGAAAWVPNGPFQPAEWVLSSLIDITAKGGNFEVGYGPMANGKFDPRAVERLEYVGRWLAVNGEAIYGTRPREGDLWREGNDLRFTRSKDDATVYAICLKWPGDALKLKTVQAMPGSEIRLLGFDKQLAWHQEQGELLIAIPAELQPEANRPCQQAYCFKILRLKPIGTR